MHSTPHDAGQRHRGQTMLEAIVAIGIILGGTASSLTLVSASIKGEKESETAIIAVNLAREGIEAVRGIRDSNWLADAAWDDGLEGAGSDYTGIPSFDPTANAWTVDFGPANLIGEDARVYRYNADVGSAVIGLHVQATVQLDSTVATPFKRLVTLNAICEDLSTKTSGSNCGALEKIGIQAVSTVQWQAPGGGTKTYVLEERMMNWH